jgi:hypothetical protein
MTGLEQFHQSESDDETYSSPFQASQNSVKHPGPTVAQATAALKPTRPRNFLNFWLGEATAIPGAAGSKIGVVCRFSAQKMCCSLEIR